MKPPQDAEVRQARSRLGLLGGLFALAFVGLAVRTVDLALLSGEAVTTTRAAVRTLAPARRADIVDRNGLLIATDYPKNSVFADPSLVLDPAATADRLAEVLYGVEAESLVDKLATKRRFVWVKRHITDAEQRAIIKLGLPGIDFRTEFHRVYPQRALASHVVGYVGVENQGLAGIERSFDRRLAGRGTGRGPLRLTLDLGVQEVVRSELAAARARFQAKGASGLVLDATTGAILAMVSLPDFDPNRYGRADDEARFNRNTQGSYELGSLFKVFTAAMALDAGTTDITAGYDATFPIRMRRHQIRDFHAKKRWLNVPEVIAFSSNIGAAKMAQELGAEGQRRYFERFGLLQRHPIRLPEVGRPQLPRKWRPINTVTAAYGHGIAVTPLQVADGVAAVLCGSSHRPGHVVPEVQQAVRDQAVVSEVTAAQLRWMMWLTVTFGTGTQAQVPGYLIGGKTGSADKPGPRGYGNGGLLSSFVAAVPIDRPRYVVLVTLDEPQGDAATFNWAHGGWTAAPTVRQIVSRIGPILGLPPAEPDDARWFRQRLVIGEAFNGRQRRTEPSYAAAPGVSWSVPGEGEQECGCGPCSIPG